MKKSVAPMLVTAVGHDAPSLGPGRREESIRRARTSGITRKLMFLMLRDWSAALSAARGDRVTGPARRGRKRVGKLAMGQLC